MTYIVFAHKPVVRLARRAALVWRRLADAPLDSSTVCAARPAVPGARRCLRRPDRGRPRARSRR
ncbi:MULTISPECIES: hypothetical protein [Streptomyces]|uniref:hypothetical protein n=1 Tax=Streptomyces TaxID=1883 RepID=UPI0006EB7EB7|nr:MULTISPECIES: hypothetical protein [Streptomyces]